MAYLPRFLFIVGVLLLTISCKKDPLNGVDTVELFAPPTSQEIEAIKSDWQQRNLTPQNIIIEQKHTITSRLTLNIISFKLNGTKEYAGVFIPVTSKPLPVRMFVYGFGLNEPVTYNNLSLAGGDTATLPFVYVVPALKGQSLQLVVNSKNYTSPLSEGSREDAFDGATDDAIATLNAVSLTFSEANTLKATIRGGSRGGTVALLAAERDKRFKLAVGVAFPSDLVGLTSSHQNDPTYKFQFLDGLISGSSSIEETRKKMIASSPLYFCDLLPKSQMHFGEMDVITPIAQGQMIIDKMVSLNLQDSIALYKYSGRSHDNIGNDNPEMQERIEQFFQQIY